VFLFCRARSAGSHGSFVECALSAEFGRIAAMSARSTRD
jgi:hypothetical protein